MKSAEQILNEAKSYVKINSSVNDYYNYNYFKNQLIDNGHYGYERELADIFNI